MGFTLQEAFVYVEMHLLAQLELIKRYTEPHRIYHNIEHVEEMLRWVPDDHPEAYNIIEAILYHDIVHSPNPTPAGLDEALSCAEYLMYTLTGL